MINFLHETEFLINTIWNMFDTALLVGVWYLQVGFI